MEAIIHSIRQVVEEAQDQGEDDEDLLILRVDLINALNQVDRDTAFKEVEDHFPEMLFWVLTCYMPQASIYPIFHKICDSEHGGLASGGSTCFPSFLFGPSSHHQDHRP